MVNSIRSARTVDGECQVSVQINSVHVENGFYCTWLILYAEDPDEGEVPFTALCLENEPEWIRPASSIVGKLAHFLAQVLLLLVNSLWFDVAVHIGPAPPTPAAHRGRVGIG